MIELIAIGALTLLFAGVIAWLLLSKKSEEPVVEPAPNRMRLNRQRNAVNM
jgi:hypothetical protein